MKKYIISLIFVIFSGVKIHSQSEISQYDYIGDFYNNRAIVERNGLYGAINREGKEVIPCQFIFLRNFISGSAVFYTIDSSRIDNQTTSEYSPTIPCLYWMGTINIHGNILIPPVYRYIEDYGKNGIRTVAVDMECSTTEGFYFNEYGFEKNTGKWGFVDSVGNVLVDMVYDAGSINKGIKMGGNYNHDILDYGTFGVTNRQGEIIIPFEYENLLPAFTNGFIFSDQESKWGILDKNGKVMSRVKYDLVFIDYYNHYDIKRAMVNIGCTSWSSWIGVNLESLKKMVWRSFLGYLILSLIYLKRIMRLNRMVNLALLI